MSHQLDTYYRDSKDVFTNAPEKQPNFDPKTGISWRAPIPNLIHFNERHHS